MKLIIFHVKIHKTMQNFTGEYYARHTPAVLFFCVSLIQVISYN